MCENLDKIAVEILKACFMWTYDKGKMNIVFKKKMNNDEKFDCYKGTFTIATMIVNKTLYVSGNDIFTNRGDKTKEDINEIRDLFSVDKEKLKEIQRKGKKLKNKKLIAYKDIRPQITKNNKYRGQLKNTEQKIMEYDIKKLIKSILFINKLIGYKVVIIDNPMGIVDRMFHAEMQLLSYMINNSLIPTGNYIGVSKSCCYLCATVLKKCGLKFKKYEKKETTIEGNWLHPLLAIRSNILKKPINSIYESEATECFSKLYQDNMKKNR